MNQEDRDQVIYDLGYEIYDYLENDEHSGLLNLVTKSNGTGWSYETMDDLETWDKSEGSIGFLADITFSGDADEDRLYLFESIHAKILGEATFDGSEWHISDCKELTLEEGVDHEDDYKYYIDAVLSNTNYFETFQREIESLKELNRVELADVRTQAMLKRQVYSGSISCLETFLSDALINTVLSNPEYLRKFFVSFKFDNKTIELKSLVEYKDILFDIAKKEMSKILYHNIAKVRETYRSVLELEFPPFDELARAVLIRHDLIHRNNRTIEGAAHVIDENAVDKVIGLVESFVIEVNLRLKALDDMPF